MYPVLIEGTMTEVLSGAAEILTWLITQMGAVVNFVTSNPLIMVGFLVSIAGLAINFFLRLFKSV